MNQRHLELMAMFRRSRLSVCRTEARRGRRRLFLGMLLVCGLVSCAGGVGAAAAMTYRNPVSDDEVDVINSMTVSIVVIPDGTVGVRETIDVDTGSSERAGFVRHIPLVRKAPDGKFRSVKVIQPSATRDGKPIPVVQVAEEDYSVLVLGEPDAMVNGMHRYSILYSLDGAIDTDVSRARRVSTIDLTGGNLPAVGKVSVVLNGPVRMTECRTTRPCSVVGESASLESTVADVRAGDHLMFSFESSLAEVAERNGSPASDPVKDALVQVIPGVVSGSDHSNGAGGLVGVALALLVVTIGVFGVVNLKRISAR